MRYRLTLRLWLVIAVVAGSALLLPSGSSAKADSARPGIPGAPAASDPPGPTATPSPVPYCTSLSSIRVLGRSMEPNIHDGQVVIAQAVSPSDLERGDVIVFEFDGRPLVRRLIGLPGESVEIHDSRVFVNGGPLAEPYAVLPPTYRASPVPLGPDEFFVLGDNRDNSRDSHTFGPIPGAGIQRRVVDPSLPSACAFREVAPLVPDLTTHIPTPLDIATDPAVVAANLLLAALAMLVFIAASEVLNHTLAEHEAELQRMLRPARWLDHGLRHVERVAAGRLGRPGVGDVVKLGGVVVFYGLIFSWLDPRWSPLSVAGAYLFLSMTVAFGVVGLADDMQRWQAARRWGLPVALTVRPANLLLAVASTACSRAFALTPGLMFGTPEAFEIDETGVEARLKAELVRVGLGSMVAIGASAWLITTLTSLLQRRVAMPGAMAVVAGGLESLLLLIFAVALQNTFLQMLALPGSYGQALRQWNRWLWAGGLLAITFLLYHTLINPQGDLAAALTSANVRFFFSTIAVFAAATLAAWLYFRWRRRERIGKTLHVTHVEH